MTVLPGVVEAGVERRENDAGLVEPPKEKADRLKIWDEIAEACENEEPVEGVITGRVKGGLTVDIGVKAFLPGSQVDLRPVRNLEKYIGQRFHFKVIVQQAPRVRRALLEKQREALGADPGEAAGRHAQRRCGQEHHRLRCVHRPRRHRRPAAHHRHVPGAYQPPVRDAEIGQQVRVKVLTTLSASAPARPEQNTEDPWLSVEARYGVGEKVSGKVVSLADYGAFIGSKRASRAWSTSPR